MTKGSNVLKNME